jgi:hypothetical protein
MSIPPPDANPENFLLGTGGYHNLRTARPYNDEQVFRIDPAPIIAFSSVVLYSYANARRLGPWLIYDKATGRVTLPRERVTFERQEIVHVQYITTRMFDRQGSSDGERSSEINLVTCRDGHRKRWPLLRSIANMRAFKYILKPLLKNTNLPVMRVEGGRGWTVTEKPYVLKGKS